MIDALLKNKTFKEKSTIKAREIVKSLTPSTFTKGGLTVEVQSIAEIDGGLEVFAKASLDGQPLGFGPDGTVEIERFRFFNPPVLVSDSNGAILREWTDERGIQHQRKLREDPAEALRLALVHTISVASQKITPIEGKVGNTTSTFYPSAGVAAPFDGWVGNTDSGYSTTRNAATGDSSNQTEPTHPVATNYDEGAGLYAVRRAFFGFDLTAIGTDTISAATFSLAGTGSGPENANSDSISVVSATPASQSTISTADFDQFGSTVYATKTFAAWNSTDTAYNDFALDATGLAYVANFVNLTDDIGFLGTRSKNDIDNSTPTGGNNLVAYYSDQAGTSADPKLVLVHAAAASAATPRRTLLGVGI